MKSTLAEMERRLLPALAGGPPSSKPARTSLLPTLLVGYVRNERGSGHKTLTLVVRRRIRTDLSAIVADFRYRAVQGFVWHREEGLARRMPTMEQRTSARVEATTSYSILVTLLQIGDATRRTAISRRGEALRQFRITDTMSNSSRAVSRLLRRRECVGVSYKPTG